MKKRPDGPEQWDNPELTVYREFELNSYQIGIIRRLIKENMYDKGNEGWTRANLLGVLRSMEYFSFQKDQFMRSHPKTWRIRLFLFRLARKIDVKFKTKRYKGEITMHKLLKD